jgi:two-component system, sensor histidine kinase PdtaS
VPSVADLLREHTSLREDDLRWLTALLGEWHLLSDLSFADLVLWLPRRGGEGYVAGAQVRPTTAPTSYSQDMVGRTLEVGRRPLVDAAYETGRIRRDSDPEWWDAVPVRVEAIPVLRGGRVIAVVSRTTNLVAARTPSRLELVYLEAAGMLARMIAEGRFPQADVAPARRGAPRVGDGLIRLQPGGEVSFASPNAMSAFRRLGLVGDLVGHQLGAVARGLTAESAAGPIDESLDTVLSGARARQVEVGSSTGVLTVRVIPLDPDGVLSGAIVLVRDVTELRRRDQQLLTKDATIREIHHRVKNNLQTVASLLRLQSRRVGDPAAQAALREAVQRVRAIAVVHEMLAERTDEDVDLDEVLDRLAAMALEVTARADAATLTRHGRAGRVPAELATSVAMAVAELLQNALEHGLAERSGTVTITARRTDQVLVLAVEDDGWGIPPGLDPESSGSLGLRIVTTLVRERGGSFVLARREPGTRAELAVPLR